MLLPTMVSHKIDTDSPFYEMTPEKLAECNFELVRKLGYVRLG